MDAEIFHLPYCLNSTDYAPIQPHANILSQNPEQLWRNNAIQTLSEHKACEKKHHQHTLLTCSLTLAPPPVFNWRTLSPWPSTSAFNACASAESTDALPPPLAMALASSPPALAVPLSALGGVQSLPVASLYCFFRDSKVCTSLSTSA